MLSHTPKTSFKYLLETRKTIPAYQRDFVWEPDIVESFVRNLWEASEDTSIDSYFCGSMVLFKNQDNVYEIVDGQQRTTVIHILVSCLIHMITDSNQRRSITDKFLVSRNISGTISSYNFFHRLHETNEFFEQLVDDKIDRSKIDPNNLTLGTLHDSFEVIKEFLIQTLKGDQKKVEKLLEFVVDKAFVIHHLSDNMANALLTYSRLNTGGKPLGHLEIVKGLLYASAENKGIDWAKIENKWDKFWSAISRNYKIGGKAPKAKEIIKQETFLTYFLLARHSSLVDDICGTNDGFTPAAKLTDLLQHPKSSKLFDNPEQTLEELSTFAKHVINMRTGKHADSDVANGYTDVALLSQSQTSPLIFMLTIVEEPQLEKKLLDYVFRLTFMFTTSVTGSGSTQGTWKKLAKIFREEKRQGKSTEDICRELEDELLNQISHFYQTNFVEYLRKEDIFSSRQQLKKILRLLEIIIRREQGYSQKIQYADWYMDGTADVDHIDPKNINSHPQTANNIGNATLLNFSANRSLKDTPFSNPKKQHAYGTSEFFQTKAIVTDEAKAFGAEKSIVGLFSNFKLANDVEIKNRANEIEGLFRKFLLKKN